MPSVGRYIYKVCYTGLPVIFDVAYNAALRIDIAIPIDPVPNNALKGMLGTIKIIGSVKDAATKDLWVTVCYDQAGTNIMFGEETGTITPAVTGTKWVLHIDYNSLMWTMPKDHPEGTVSIFIRTNNGHATVTDLDFIWES